MIDFGDFIESQRSSGYPNGIFTISRGRKVVSKIIKKQNKKKNSVPRKKECS